MSEMDCDISEELYHQGDRHTLRMSKCAKAFFVYPHYVAGGITVFGCGENLRVLLCS
jgi:hypothetical protein